MAEEVYADSLKVAEALRIYFSRYHFKDGGYQDKWFKIKVGPFYLPFPNIRDRVDAVKIHDVNHVLTGYKANYRGEAQIGGWELASGCGRFYMAWLLNGGSFLIGLFAFPAALWRAFMAGRLLRRNLYRDRVYDEGLLGSSLGELRAWLREGARKKNTAGDYLLFVWFALLSLLYIAIPAAMIIMIC